MSENLIQRLKNNDFPLPIWLGQLLSNISYSYRPVFGKSYRNAKNAIYEYDNMTTREKQEYIFNQMRNIVEYAYANIPFYQHFYDQHAFSPECLKSFEDIQKIPIIDKTALLNYPLEARSNLKVPHFKVNTGGSTGQTLAFYAQPISIGIEWAHIHRMWAMLGYKPTCLKFGVNTIKRKNNGVDYNFARHNLSIDMYKPYAETAPLFKKILKKHPCYYMHGYPSTLSDFTEYCQQDPELRDMLCGMLRGAFLSSEFPFPMYRDKIEQTFGIRTQSFYGHTERCVMAYETEEKFKYVPFQTYGFAEAINNGEGHYDLIGTSYYNQASPLIRYNTKDVIDNPTYDAGIMTSFNIFEGRSGQFILDANGKKISLTGLIMGRHHEIFDHCLHIQVSQESPGKATIYYMPNRKDIDIDPYKLFDSSNVDVDFTFEKIDEPIRTPNGKIKLLVDAYVKANRGG